MDGDPPRHGIQLYRRLSISQNDLWEAELCAERLAVNPPEDQLLRQALTMAAVVSYARAFTTEERALHGRVLVARHTEVAHSDTTVHALTVTLGEASTLTGYRVKR